MPIVADALFGSSSSAFLKLAAAFAASPDASCCAPRLAKNSLCFSGPPAGLSGLPYGSCGASLPLTPFGGVGGGGVGDGGVGGAVTGVPPPGRR
jgi:hypothetical protein